MTYNYWGYATAHHIISRVKDGRTLTANLKIQVIPYFTTEALQNLSSISLQKSTVKEDNILNGLISRSTVLSTGNPVYDILGNLEVPLGVTLTIPQGVVIHLQPDSNVFVYGTLLVKGMFYYTQFYIIDEDYKFTDLLLDCDFRLCFGSIDIDI